MNSTPKLQQRRFHQHYLKSERLAEHLQDQSERLRQIEFALLHEDSFEINSKVVELDFELIRYTCALLARQLEEAATSDCATLLADSILDTSCENFGARWTSWLRAAPCWPVLAKEKWPYARPQVVEIIVERLRSAGVTVNFTAVGEIESAIGDLELSDVMPPDTFAGIFPESQDEEGETDG